VAPASELAWSAASYPTVDEVGICAAQHLTNEPGTLGKSQ